MDLIGKSLLITSITMFHLQKKYSIFNQFPLFGFERGKNLSR